MLKHTLQVRLEGLLGRLHALLGLEPDETKLVLNVVDHDSLAFTTAIITTLSGGVGALELDVLVLVLHELLAVALPQEAVLLDVEGVGEQFISGDNVLNKHNLQSAYNSTYKTLWDCDRKGLFDTRSRGKRNVGFWY